MVALAEGVHARQPRAEAAAVRADQRRGQVAVDRVLDRLGRLSFQDGPPMVAASPKAGRAAGQPELDDDRALAADGAERQLVRADGGDVEDARLDAFMG